MNDNALDWMNMHHSRIPSALRQPQHPASTYVLTLNADFGVER